LFHQINVINSESFEEESERLAHRLPRRRKGTMMFFEQAQNITFHEWKLWLYVRFSNAHDAAMWLKRYDHVAQYTKFPTSMGKSSNLITLFGCAVSILCPPEDSLVSLFKPRVLFRKAAEVRWQSALYDVAFRVELLLSSIFSRRRNFHDLLKFLRAAYGINQWLTVLLNLHQLSFADIYNHFMMNNAIKLETSPIQILQFLCCASSLSAQKFIGLKYPPQSQSNIL